MTRGGIQLSTKDKRKDNPPHPSGSSIKGGKTKGKRKPSASGSHSKSQTRKDNDPTSSPQDKESNSDLDPTRQPSEQSEKDSTGCRDTMIKELMEIKGEIEQGVEDFDGGKLSDLSECSSSEKILIYQNELLNQIRSAEDHKLTLQRIAADFDNYKKRVEKEREAFIKYASENLILKFLGVLDNLERALQNEKREEDPFVGGVKLIHSQFVKVLADEGVEAIDQLGDAFDPYRHDCMMQEMNNDLDEDTITDIFQKGFILKGKVIRPAKVRISKKES